MEYEYLDVRMKGFNAYLTACKGLGTPCEEIAIRMGEQDSENLDLQYVEQLLATLSKRSRPR